MSTFERLAEKLTDEDFKFFSNANKSRGLIPTGELIREEWQTGAQSLVVFRGKWTPWGCLRDCGDHYIIARWDRYDRIEKTSLKVTLDVEDE